MYVAVSFAMVVRVANGYWIDVPVIVRKVRMRKLGLRWQIAWIE